MIGFSRFNQNLSLSTDENEMNDDSFDLTNINPKELTYEQTQKKKMRIYRDFKFNQ